MIVVVVRPLDLPAGVVLADELDGVAGFVEVTDFGDALDAERVRVASHPLDVCEDDRELNARVVGVLCCIEELGDRDGRATQDAKCSRKNGGGVGHGREANLLCQLGDGQLWGTS